MSNAYEGLELTTPPTPAEIAKEMLKAAFHIFDRNLDNHYYKDKKSAVFKKSVEDYVKSSNPGLRRLLQQFLESFEYQKCDKPAIMQDATEAALENLEKLKVFYKDENLLKKKVMTQFRNLATLPTPQYDGLDEVKERIASVFNKYAKEVVGSDKDFLRKEDITDDLATFIIDVREMHQIQDQRSWECAYGMFDFQMTEFIKNLIIIAQKGNESLQPKDLKALTDKDYAWKFDLDLERPSTNVDGMSESQKAKGHER